MDVSGLNLLIVEDEHFSRNLTEKMLRYGKEGRIFTASDGKEALQIIEHSANPFDAIFLDLEMPKMDGLSMLKTMRAGLCNADPDIPVIILTSHGDAETVSQALKIGISGYVLKPASRSTLISQLQKALAR